MLHSFSDGDGAFPASPLIQLSDGRLYGTTSSGTASFRGVVFRLDTAGRGFKVLHEFTGPDGAFPYSPLVAASDGYLYGTTYAGGSAELGTIFRIKPAGDGFAVVHSFSGSDGSSVFAGLVQGADGGLYGAARDGGSLGGGVAFRIDRASYKLLVSKSGTGSGKVSSTPAGINCGNTCSADFAVSSNVTLTPTPSSNSLFSGWTGDPDCTDGSVTMAGDRACTAVFNLGPDLVIESVNGPSSARPGQSVTLTDKTKNRGAAAVASSVTKFFLSSDAVLDSGDFLLASRNVPALNAGAFSQAPVVITIPASLAPGHYKVIVVADADGQRAETDETNNERDKPMNVH